jgi:transglutaminase-like putative cysteine protease
MTQEPRSPKDGVSRKSRGAGVFCALFPVLVVLWVVLVLYPNPLSLAVSIQRLADPRVDPGAVQTLAESLPSEPAAIEKAVLDSMPYSYDWEAYAMPWYFPTVDEVLEKGRGDCKARAIVLASVFEAKGIPYRINSSPMHVWVDYDGKVEDELENSGAGFYEVDPQTGARSLDVPKISVTEVMAAAWQGFWPPMPMVRKVLLVSGLVILVAIRVMWPRTGRLARSGPPRCVTSRPLIDRSEEHQRLPQEESRLA